MLDLTRLPATTTVSFDPKAELDLLMEINSICQQVRGRVPRREDPADRGLSRRE